MRATTRSTPKKSSPSRSPAPKKRTAKKRNSAKPATRTPVVKKLASRTSATPLRAGTPAPDFTLYDKDNNTTTLSALRGKQVVLFFYPKDNTPGCTIETKQINDLLTELEKKGAVVLGISGGDGKSKAKFCRDHQLSVTLLSDTDFAVAARYGVYGEKTFMGRTYMGISRTSFIVDANGTISKVFDQVKPEGHAKELLGAL